MAHEFGRRPRHHGSGHRQGHQSRITRANRLKRIGRAVLAASVAAGVRARPRAGAAFGRSAQYLDRAVRGRPG
ncbi:hypothetical protein GCM10022206_28680 [Streptomyces chiangmaiensis]